MSDQKSPMDALGFRWQLGEIVCHKGEIYPWCEWSADMKLPTWAEGLVPPMSPPTRLIIVERLAQECPGGIQRKYKVTAVFPGKGPAMQTAEFLEIELENYPQRPTRKD